MRQRSATTRRTVDAVMLEERAASFTRRSIKSHAKAAGLRVAMSMLDLTTLEGKDSPEKVRALCRKAVRPYEFDLPDQPPIPSVAAVCVYPSLVVVAKQALAGSTVKVASVAAGFPSGQYPLDVRLKDVHEAVEAGADEIDMVINRGAFLAGRYDEVAEEIREVKAACGAVPPLLKEGVEGCVKRADDGAEAHTQYGTHHTHPGPPPQGGGRGAPLTQRGGRGAHFKIILETGELETYDNVRRASDLAIEAASSAPGDRRLNDGEVFIKTSTGKVQPAATMPVTLVMLEAIRDHYLATGVKIGMKPAGGIRSAKQALHYLVMVKETLGEEWLTPTLFRFGASSLANDLLRQIVKEATGRYAASYDFSEA